MVGNGMNRVDKLPVDQGLAVAETVALPARAKFSLDSPLS